MIAMSFCSRHKIGRKAVINQIVGNLGGWVENSAIDISTDFVIIPDAMVEAS